ncbi:MAG: DNA-directed DNA polymerase II small subunit [Candidatus Marsarchaeota archaeon]|nr:DNA-directed DNA polymerase II small subunit [Candidatus Marsarchaeota archaeon]
MADLKQLVNKLSQLKILLASDVAQQMLDGIDENSLLQKIIEMKSRAASENPEEAESKKELEFIGSADILRMAGDIATEKVPVPVEVSRSPEFKPEAAEIEGKFKVSEKEITAVTGIDDFTKHFNNRLARIKKILDRRQGIKFLSSLEDIGKNRYMSGREVAVAGIVSKRIATKNGNIMVELEDGTGTVKVIFMSRQAHGQKSGTFDDAARIVNDEVIGVKGKLSHPFIIANEIVWPEPVIKTERKFEEDFSVAFLSDIHTGSKLFMEKNFLHMLKWIQGRVGENNSIAGKIKYIVIAGDAADGIGIYPNQDRDLQVLDVYQQYSMLFNMLEAVPDYIHVFVMPGNHDATQRAEPQPPFDASIIRDFRKSNVHIVQNPSFMSLNGLEVLSYHGTSLDSVIAAIPGLAYSRPEEAMTELLKRRHLSPIYGGNIILPSAKDNLVIDKTPDILHMGHIHTNGIGRYKGVWVVNSGTWQSKTEFQTRQGHMPTPCKMPVFNSKTNKFTTVNFS